MYLHYCKTKDHLIFSHMKKTILYFKLVILYAINVIIMIIYMV